MLFDFFWPLELTHVSEGLNRQFSIMHIFELCRIHNLCQISDSAWSLETSKDKLCGERLGHAIVLKTVQYSRHFNNPTVSGRRNTHHLSKSCKSTM